MILDYVVLGVAALLAGMIDAIVGGGGLIQIPALFSVLPNVIPATLLGTNKLAGVWGTGVAAISFARRVKLEWSTAAPAAVAAFILSFLGAYTVTKIPPDFLRKVLPFILLAVVLYTFKRKDFGSIHEPLHEGIKEKLIAIGVGGCIGFYDGFFGPGTGSFLVFLFVRFFGFDFLGGLFHVKHRVRIVAFALCAKYPPAFELDIVSLHRIFNGMACAMLLLRIQASH